MVVGLLGKDVSVESIADAEEPLVVLGTSISFVMAVIKSSWRRANARCRHRFFLQKRLREPLELNIQAGLHALLQALDVPRAAIDREIGEMQFFMYGKASNRRCSAR